MSTFRPNLVCTVSKRRMQRDLFAQNDFGPATPSRCSVVKFTSKAEKTSVRADSSGSRGKADESTVDAVLLFPVTEILTAGDRVNVLSTDLEVLGVFPRHDVAGRLHHYEVSAMIDLAV